MAEAQLTNQLTRIDSMTNVELRAELKRRGCPTSGNKKDLLAKLRVALQKEFEQAALESASTTSTVDSMSLDGRNNHMAGLQQSPVVPFDVSRPSLNASTASGNSYMTPHGGSPVVYAQHMQAGEAPLTYTNLQIHDQAAGQYPPVYNLTMHQAPAPMIPVPQQLTLSPAESHPMFNQTQQPQYSPMSTRRQRGSVDVPAAAPIPPAAPALSPEKRTRSRSKKPSVDSQPNDVPPPMPAQPAAPVEPAATESVQVTPSQPATVHEPAVHDKNGDHVEVNSLVSKSNEEEQKDLGKVREERGDSRSPSVDSSSVKSESVIKEIPLSGDRHRLSRSKSPKSRWHHSPSPQQQQANPPATIEEEPTSAVATASDDHTAPNEQAGKPSNGTLPAQKSDDLRENDKKQKDASSTKQQDTSKKEEDSSAAAATAHEQQQPEKAASQQQLKPSRSQTSAPANSLMKGLNRSAAGNRVNLSSDVLKTLIPDISLAPESVITDELEASANDQGLLDDADQPVLETSVGNGLLSDSMTIGELADQKQSRNRTVVIDVAVDPSSLNDDLLGNGADVRKKPQAPARIASFESKPLLDGKTNALMVDEPVRIKDATTALEPPSRILYIRGLTRPFTLPLLKELLGRYGALVDGEFWLDKIKSQCFAVYTTMEDAQNAREALDGCRWPSSNPKTLSVRFARQEEFDFSKAKDLPPDQMSNDAMETNNTRLVQEKPAANTKASTGERRSASPSNEAKSNNKKLRPSGNADVREWDLDKFQQDEGRPLTERRVVEEPAAKINDPPAKGLDDYFRKTEAKPAIYWLPLTDEQITERSRRREERNAEREEEQRKRQLDASARNSNSNKDSKSRSNNNENVPSNRPQRRSPSPRGKRRRVSSSVTPPRRDNKRH